VYHFLFQRLPRIFSRVRRPAPLIRRDGRRSRPAPGGGFRPRLESREDRAVPSASHFWLWDPNPIRAGQPTQLFVLAVDANNQVVSNFTGTVRLSGLGGFLGTLTFGAGDHGAHGFTLDFPTSGSQTLTATDTQDSGVTGCATANVG
jgi:hypothetical protein